MAGTLINAGYDSHQSGGRYAGGSGGDVGGNGQNGHGSNGGGGSRRPSRRDDRYHPYR